MFQGAVYVNLDVLIANIFFGVVGRFAGRLVGHMEQLSTSDGLGYRGRNRLDSGSVAERAICALGVRVYRKLRAAQTVFVEVNRTVPMNGKTNPKKAPALERLHNWMGGC